MGLFSRKKRKPVDDAADIAQDHAPALVNPTAETPGHRADFAALVDREWDRLANAGAWWTGGERLAIAHDARLAVDDQAASGVLPGPVEEATRRIAIDAASIRGADVARWEVEGLDSFAFVEIAGVVSRLMAIDTAAFGLGLPIRPLPDALPGEPTRDKPADAAITTGWAPTVGPASAPSSLTAVPAEAAAMFDLHGVLYLAIDDMFEMQIEREGLTRPQIELAAARTSALNDCFY
ncbi:MAG: hypothetical protein ACI9C1_003563 [Candidatus Aldehydirespiratoraceae bacterium]|jgi:hypothetical protein